MNFRHGIHKIALISSYSAVSHDVYNYSELCFNSISLNFASKSTSQYCFRIIGNLFDWVSLLTSFLLFI